MRLVLQQDTVQQGIGGIDWDQALRLEVVAPKVLQILVVIGVALLAHRLIRIAIARLVSREIIEEDPLLRRAREQRSKTMGSLLASVATGAIVVIVALTILDILLENIGPILASFGIIGLAFSFGAQTLVKDVISGAFILMEGQFGIGDVVRINNTSGMVERITLRTTALRDSEGIVHIIPNGSITGVSNMTKAWSRAVLDVGVAYRENVDRVIEVLKDLLQEFQHDPAWSGVLLDEPQVVGVNALADSAVIIRCQAKTLPLKQWDVARELRRRIKNRFDREGIEIPFPHTTLYWGDGQMPGPAPAAAGSRNDEA